MGDEHAFFHWLQSISYVESVVGRSTDLCIRLRHLPGRPDLRELIGVLYRYQMNMRPLARLKSARNASWFAEDGRVYRHVSIFGKPKRSLDARRHSEFKVRVKKVAGR